MTRKVAQLSAAAEHLACCGVTSPDATNGQTDWQNERMRRQHNKTNWI